MVRLESIGVKANLYSMASEAKNGECKVLERALENDRDTRHRPESTEKYGAVTIAANRDFAKEVGEFGITYIRKYKEIKESTIWGEDKVFSCINDVLEGLLQWMTRQIEGRLKGASLNLRKKIIKNSRGTF